MSKIGTWGKVFFVLGGLCWATLATAQYSLDSENSSLYFVSTKNTHIPENHHFTDLTGSISQSGEARLTINHSSVETGIALRNERVRNFLFEVNNFATATVTLSVSLDLSLIHI